MLSLLKNGAPVVSLVLFVLSGAASANCVDNVILGEGDSAIATSVENKTIGNNTCLNDLIIDTEAEGANYSNHGEFVSRLTHQVKGWERQGVISHREGAGLKAAGRDPA